MSRAIGLSAAVAAAIVWLGAAAARPARAQERGEDAWAERQTFKILLRFQGYRPLDSFERILEEPQQTVVIVLGRTNRLQDEFSSVATFLKKGGAVLLASDEQFPRGAALLSFRPEFQIRRAQVEVAANSDAAYRGESFCPLISDFEEPDHPLFRGLTGKIATNRPSFLLPHDANPATTRILARFPASCYQVQFRPLRFRRPVIEPLPASAAFALVREDGRGRLLALADHSIFIDQMMMQRDNDNLAFANNCLAWLSDGGKRERLLFVDDDEIRTDFGPVVPKLDLPEPPIPSAEQLVPVVNEVVNNMQQADAFNKILLELLPGASPTLEGQLRNLWQILTVLTTLALAAYGLYRLDLSRHRREQPVVRYALLASIGAPADDAFQQRNRVLLAEDNFWEGARALARQAVATTTIGAAIGTTDACPALRVVGSWWERRRLMAQVRALWGLSRESEPRGLSRRQFAHVAQQVKDVARARAQGTLHFPEELASSASNQRIRG